MNWKKQLPYPILFLVFLVVALLLVDYVKEGINYYLSWLPYAGIVVVAVGFICLLVLFLVFKIRLPFGGK